MTCFGVGEKSRTRGGNPAKNGASGGARGTRVDSRTPFAADIGLQVRPRRGRFYSCRPVYILLFSVRVERFIDARTNTHSKYQGRSRGGDDISQRDVQAYFLFLFFHGVTANDYGIAARIVRYGITDTCNRGSVMNKSKRGGKKKIIEKIHIAGRRRYLRRASRSVRQENTGVSCRRPLPGSRIVVKF